MPPAMYQALMFPELKMLLEENDVAGMAEFCEVLHPAVTAEILEKLDAKDAWKVLKTCKLDRQVEIIEYMSLSGQVDLINVMDRKKLTRLLEEMSPDDRVDLEEVEAACSRVIIIDRGRIVANGTPAELKARSPEGRLEDVFRAITLPDTVKAH